MENEYLLTIAIPTFNRSNELKQCLNSILSQLSNDDDLVEVIVSDNDSPDNTKNVVYDYIDTGYKIKYLKNATNVGMDKNIINCFKVSKGKYLLIMGDDDLLLEESLKKILNLLSADDYGVVYLSSYGFTGDYRAERPDKSGCDVLVFDDPDRYLRKVHYWITFLSGNIVNKSLVADVDPNRFAGSNLPQLGWFIPALYKAGENAYISEYMVAFKAFNTGGYKLCQVFGENLNNIFEAFIANGANRQTFDCINKKLVTSFFPNLILIQRKGSSGFSFESENYFKSMRQVFGKYLSFWIVTLPVIRLPLMLASIWFKLINRI